VGCNLTLHVQDNQMVKFTSPADYDITRGNLCIKGAPVPARQPEARPDRQRVSDGAPARSRRA
jgi:anaerobic selenocysteine-containing dehydrogenase